MVCLFSGTPRSGKSLDSIRYIISRSLWGKPVITNFGCKLDKYKKANYTYCPNESLTPGFLIRYAQEFWGNQPVRENDILLVIDEAQLLFPAIGTKMKNRMEWLRFFTLHGKLGYHIILITQNDRMIDRQIRGVIEYEYIHRKLNNFGARGLLLRLVTLGKQYVVVQRWYPIKETISKEFFSGSKKLYSIYDSYVLFSTDGHKKIEDSKEKPLESSTADVYNVKQHKSLILWRSACKYVTTFVQRCQCWVFRIYELLPHCKCGKFSQAAKRNELGWTIQEVNHVEEETESLDVLDLQILGDLVPGDGQHDGVLC